jgi:RHH-type proline utilization regulon transcriptional repressor/proline dehydrogenase/delta 1-pyrroline-5-carboxylate dehydrogenase
VVRAARDTDAGDIAIARAVAAAVGSEVDWSGAEDDDAFAERMVNGSPSKVRLLGTHDEALLRALHRAGMWIDTTPVVADGELELLRWTREQSVSRTRHRHGNVVNAMEPSTD